MDRAISHKSELRANVTNVAFIRGPPSVAGGRPPAVFGVIPLAASLPAFVGLPLYPVFPFPRMSVGILCVEEDDMK